MDTKIATLSKRNMEIIDEISALQTELDSLEHSDIAHGNEMASIKHDIEVLERDFNINLKNMHRIAKGQKNGRKHKKHRIG